MDWRICGISLTNAVDASSALAWIVSAYCCVHAERQQSWRGWIWKMDYHSQQYNNKHNLLSCKRLICASLFPFIEWVCFGYRLAASGSGNVMPPEQAVHSKGNAGQAKGERRNNRRFWWTNAHEKRAVVSLCVRASLGNGDFESNPSDNRSII